MEYAQATYLVDLPKTTSPEQSQMCDGTVIPCGPRILRLLNRRVIAILHRTQAGGVNGKGEEMGGWELRRACVVLLLRDHEVSDSEGFATSSLVLMPRIR